MICFTIDSPLLEPVSHHHQEVNRCEHRVRSGFVTYQVVTNMHRIESHKETFTNKKAKGKD